MLYLHISTINHSFPNSGHRFLWPCHGHIQTNLCPRLDGKDLGWWRFILNFASHQHVHSVNPKKRWHSNAICYMSY